MKQPSKRDKHTLVEEKTEAPEAVSGKGGSEKQLQSLPERQKGGKVKNRGSFWSRIVNFTVEERKIVVLRDGEIKLIPVSSEPIEEKTKVSETFARKESAKKQSEASTEGQKNGKTKTRCSFWSRIINFTVEERKTVVIKDGEIKLVPVSTETVIIEEVEEPPRVVTEEPVAVLPETLADKDVTEDQSLTPAEPVSVLPLSQESGIVEEAEEPSQVVTEEPVSVLLETSTGKDVTEDQSLTSAEPVSVLPQTAPVEERVEEEIPVSSEKLRKGLEKTRNRFWSRLKNLFSLRRKIDESVLEELEDILIGSDIGAKPVQTLIRETHEAWKSKKITETSQIHSFIKERLKETLRSLQIDITYAPTSPTVIMVVGVNGVGKTTAIAKLANSFIKDGKKVMVAASDTFRAAAVEQLEIWSKRIGAEIVKHQTGSDPAAVAYDALESSIARRIDVVIVDTAGRLHTHENLMNELSKIKRVISKRIPGAPHEVLMVLDATTGQNALSQAKMFKQAVDVTGIFLAKLDGTAKGGFVLGMRNEINIPVKFIGLGEKADDIEKFNPDAFVDALFE